MDPDLPKSTPRKVRFPPKRLTRSSQKPKTEPPAEDDNDSHESLSRLVNAHLRRRGPPKTEKKQSTAPVQVAFQHGTTSTAIRTFGKQKEKIEDGIDTPEEAKESSPLDDDMQITVYGTEEVTEDSEVLPDVLTVKKKKEYIEPWDYENSYYPITLPWRPPYSGRPEVLDQAEFGEKAVEYDENTVLSASELGLLDQDDKPQMIFFQFPPTLPPGVQPTIDSRKQTADNSKALTITATNQNETAGTKGKETAGSSVKKSVSAQKVSGCSLDEMPEGLMGKMVIYKSGAVKLKLGNVLFDVSHGSDVDSAQIVTAMNTKRRHCCALGELNKRAVVTPDIDALLESDHDVVYVG